MRKSVPIDMHKHHVTLTSLNIEGYYVLLMLENLKDAYSLIDGKCKIKKIN